MSQYTISNVERFLGSNKYFWNACRKDWINAILCLLMKFILVSVLSREPGLARYPQFEWNTAMLKRQFSPPSGKMRLLCQIGVVLAHVCLFF
jgi:hypothetical protein